MTARPPACGYGVVVQAAAALAALAAFIVLVYRVADAVADQVSGVLAASNPDGG